MKSLFWFLICIVFFLIVHDIYHAIAFTIISILFIELLINSNNNFAFREWVLFLYAMNYLIAPAITYNLPDDVVLYGMKLNSSRYFELAVPGYLCFVFGMYFLPTKIFKLDFSLVNKASMINQSRLVQITIFGVILGIVTPFIRGELHFFIYLLSLVRFVGSFALFSLKRKNWVWIVIVLFMELIKAFVEGMYHDALMWVVFFAIYFVYTFKPTIQVKIIGASVLITLILFVQTVKFAYRSEVWSGQKEASLETAYILGAEQANSEGLIGADNLLSTLNRGNQAWIFASTVDNMDNTKNFQGLTNVYKYLEAAILPRFLAPGKIQSGDREIFNKFSGHVLNKGTSMGLGVFADGYVAYGVWGVYIFGFVLGLIFSLTFKLVERWTKLSPFYVLLLLPLLNYAVRPDCELQTILTHLFKGVLLYGFLVNLSRKSFTLDSQENHRKLVHFNFISNQ